MMLVRATRSRVLVGLAFAAMLSTFLLVGSVTPAHAADCPISQYVNPDGTIDTTSYLQCEFPTLSSNTVNPGGTVNFSAGGFTPGCEVAIKLDGGTTLTTVTADPRGGINAPVTIPTNTSLGEHRLEATCGALTVSLPISVVAAGTTTPTTPVTGSLPTTGTNVGQYVGLAVILLALGGVAVWSSRRGRKPVDTTV